MLKEILTDNNKKLYLISKENIRDVIYYNIEVDGTVINQKNKLSLSDIQLQYIMENIDYYCYKDFKECFDRITYYKWLGLISSLRE